MDEKTPLHRERIVFKCPICLCDICDNAYIMPHIDKKSYTYVSNMERIYQTVAVKHLSLHGIEIPEEKLAKMIREKDGGNGD